VLSGTRGLVEFQGVQEEARWALLLEGAVTATDAVLRLLQPHIRAAIVWHWPHAPLDLPGGQTHALILRDAASLSRDDQRRLFEWMKDTGSRSSPPGSSTPRCTTA
jgi:hypothetical protein